MKKSTKIFSLFLAALAVCSLLSLSVFAANKVSIAKCTFSYSTSVNYTGSALKPKVTVKYGNKTLKNGTDYSLTYSSNKAVGTGKIKVTGKGNYSSSKTLSFKIVLKKPASLKASSIASSSAKLSWGKIAGASKYVVYSYNSSTKKYTALATVKTNSATLKLKTNTKYSLTVRAFDKKDNKSAMSSVLKVTTLPFAAPKPAAASASTSSVALSWKKISGAKGYRIYTYNASTKKYTKLKDVSAATASYTVTGLKAGTKYGYAVAAYKTSGSTKVLGDRSAVVYAYTLPAKVSSLNAIYAGAKMGVLSWKKVSGASGYQVFSYDSSKKAYTKLLTTKDTSASVTSLKPETSYKFSVRAYCKLGSAVSYGARSALYTLTTMPNNEFYTFRDMIESGVFSVSYSMMMDGTEASMETTVKGDKSVMTMSATLEGMSMKMNMWYDSSKKKGLVRATALGFMKVYDEISEKDAADLTLDGNVLKKLFSPEMGSDSRVFTATATVNGKKCNTYMYKTSNGTVATFYFNGGKLIQLVEGGETITVSSYTASVSDSDVAKPSVKGYVHMDLF